MVCDAVSRAASMFVPWFKLEGGELATKQHEAGHESDRLVMFFFFVLFGVGSWLATS
jgi:hypothetical protein